MIDYREASGRRKAKIVITGPEATVVNKAMGHITGVTYEKRTGAMTVIAEPRMMELVGEALKDSPSTEITTRLRDWYKGVRADEEARALPGQFSDCVFPYERADDLRPYQRVGANYMRELNRTILADDMGLGKQNANSEPILTPTGWTTMGDIAVGDYVIGRDGLKTAVVGVFPQGERAIVRVTFSDGSWSRCSWDHLWNVQSPNDSARNPERWRTYTTRELVDKGIVDGAGNRKWRIPMVSPVQYDSVSLPLDPYLLGVLLGDGGLSNRVMRITTDMEILKYVDIPGIYHPHRSEGISEFNIAEGPIADGIRSLGLYGKRSWEKFIPNIFLRGTPQERLKLLQGLMDTDGYAMPDGGAEFCSTSENLVDGVIELVQSLGGIARGRHVAASTYTHKGEKKKGRRAERVNIKLPAPLNPFRLSRKRKAYKVPTKYQPIRAIASIEEDGMEEATCIKVAADDELYVTRSFIVTHNTVQTIAAIDASEENDKVLIVCPNAVKYQWSEEIEKWSDRNEPVTVLEWKTKVDQIKAYKQGWFVMNYAQFPRYWSDYVSKMGKWDWVVFDEAHRLKNRKTRTAECARSLRTKYMAMLTGTPVGNNVAEIWSLLNILYPSMFSSYWRFYETYIDYEQDYWGSREIKGTKNPELLERDLGPVMLRRTKEDVAKDIPKKVTQDLLIEMPEKQKKAYQKMAHECYLEVREGEYISAVNVMAMITRLRQIASTPATLGLEDVSGKLDAAVEIINGTDEQVVVFTAFRDTAIALRNRLSKKKMASSLFLGGFSTRERNEVLKEFQAGRTRVFICTTKAGGTGLNLQCASVGIFIDKEWNPAEQRQAADRLHRIGQKKMVQIISLIARGTIDHTVEGLLAKKIEMTEPVLRSTLLEEVGKFS